MRKLPFVFILFVSLLCQFCYGMVKCPFCAFDNEDGALFCDRCKADLSTNPTIPGVATMGIQTGSPAGSVPVTGSPECPTGIRPAFPGIP